MFESDFFKRSWKWCDPAKNRSRILLSSVAGIIFMVKKLPVRIVINYRV
ncbi:hypothetical protein [Liquorilactobacillus oeni]|nr:hypothetical protein [Liquorilactobacillus oeni]